MKRTICPVNPPRGCIGCHMPAVKDVVPHSTFTDHFISFGYTASDRRPVHRQWLNKNAGLLIKAHVIS
jgi:hypothetical protein